MEKEIDIPRIEDLERVLMAEGSQYERWEWRIKGISIKHHPTEPAVQYTNGNWKWFWVNQVHRWDGPATNWKGKYEYWIMDEWLSREEWERDPLRLEWLGTQAERI